MLTGGAVFYWRHGVASNLTCWPCDSDRTKFVWQRTYFNSKLSYMRSFRQFAGVCFPGWTRPYDSPLCRILKCFDDRVVTAAPDALPSFYASCTLTNLHTQAYDPEVLIPHHLACLCPCLPQGLVLINVAGSEVNRSTTVAENA